MMRLARVTTRFMTMGVAGRSSPAGSIVLDFGDDAGRFRALAEATAGRLGEPAAAAAAVARAFVNGDSRRYMLPARFWPHLRFVVVGGVPVHGAALHAPRRLSPDDLTSSPRRPVPRQRARSRTSYGAQ